jgi:hypothetical protein
MTLPARQDPHQILLHPSCTLPVMSQQPDTLLLSKEARVQLALQAKKRDATHTLRALAAIYNVDHETLSNRRVGLTYKRDYTPNSRRLLLTEEGMLIKHILDLEARKFPPRLLAVEDMANSLQAERCLCTVGINWAATFVKHRPELQTKFNRKYDYKRALCEDSEVIQRWFRLVKNMKAKHGVLDDDTYNFDESGFMKGMISTGVVVTSSEHLEVGQSRCSRATGSGRQSLLLLRHEAAELFPINVIPHLHLITDASLQSTQRFHLRHLDAIIFNLLNIPLIASESLTADFHSPRKTDRSVSQKSLSHSPPMVYDAASLLPRRGLEGDEGIPELTSGTPLHPAHQRSAVVEWRLSKALLAVV